MRHRTNAAVVCLAVRGFVNPPVSEARADDALEGSFGADGVADFQRGAIGIGLQSLTKVTADTP